MLQLDIAQRQAKRSVLRGLGPPRQAVSTPLDAVAALDDEDVLTTPVMPVEPLSVFIVVSFFMLREIEAAFLKQKHMALDLAELVVTLTLSISKSDPTAVGCKRSWGCVCIAGRVSPCPVHAMIALLGSLRARGAAWVDLEAPLFPNAAGEHCSKLGTTAMFKAVGVAAGAKALDGQAELGGHSGRVSGARHLAGLGLELALIQLMARHASSTILDYVRDAPLLSITRTTKMKTIAAAERDASVVQSWREAELNQQLAAMTSRLDDLQRECKHLAGVRLDHLAEHAEVVTTDCSPLDELVAIMNTENKKCHIAKVSPGPYLPPASWRTRCPWHYGFKPHKVMKPSTVLADPELVNNLCRRCWRGLTDLDDSSGDS